MRKNPYSLSLSSSNLTATSRSSSPSQTSATSYEESPASSPTSNLQNSGQSSKLSRKFIDTCNLEDISDVSTDVTYVNYEEKKYYHVMYYRNSSKSPPNDSKKGVLVVGDFNAVLYGKNSSMISKAPGAEIQEAIKQKSFNFNKNIEVEILEEFPEEDFLRGKCFMTHLVETVYSAQKTKRLKRLSNVPQDSYVIDSKGGVYIDKEIISILKEHQIQGVEFLYGCVMKKKKGITGGILADCMGLGKTLQTIILIYILTRSDATYPQIFKKVIVLVPASLINNWRDEIHKWLGPVKLPTLICMGNKKESEHTVSRFIKGCLIISYDTFRNYRSRLDKACDLVICDEGHRIKNALTATSRHLHAMACTKRILLTGTPLQNNLMEFYTCVSFVNPGIFGSLLDFKEVFANPIIKAQEPDAPMNVRQLGWSRATELKEITSHFIIRRTGSLLEESLPPRHEYLIFLKPSKLQKKLYKAFLMSGYVKETVRTFDVAHALSMILYLRQLLNHPDMIYFKSPSRDDMMKAWKAIKELYPSDYNLLEDRNQFSNKMLFLDNILQECISKGDKLLVVSYFTQTLDYIQSYCIKKGYSYARLDGQTQIKNRIKIVDEFNSEDSDQKLFLLSSKAGGVGLNIIGANRMIMFDGDWNPSNDKQAMGRIWRFGQKKPVYIYRMFTVGTIEEKIYQRQTAKENLFQTLMNSKNKAQKFTREYLEAIFTYSKTCETFKESDEISGEGSFLEGVNSDYISIIKRNIEDWKEVESQELDFLDAELGNYETGKRKFPDSEFNINKRAVKIK